MENLLKDLDWKGILWIIFWIVACILLFYVMDKYELGAFNPKYDKFHDQPDWN